MKTTYFATGFLILGSSFLVACGSCSKTDTPATGDAATTATTSTTSTASTASGASSGKVPPAPWASVPSATANVMGNMGFSERFQIESSSRPQGIKPNVEEVLKSLEGAGLSLAEKKQHLASPLGARYCMGARVTPSASDTKATWLHVSVCEYITADLAKASRDHSEKAMKDVIPNRFLFTNKQVMLVLKEEDKTPESDAALEKAKAAFAAL